MSDDRVTLRIGDVISLRSVKWGEYLSAEGIFKDDLVMNDGSLMYDDDLFSVHLPRQYSAQIELNEFIEKYGSDVKKLESPELVRYYGSLKRGRDNELTLNETYMKNKAGNSVLFGDSIQLYHLKSKKYITVLPKTLATVERENARIHLDPEGNQFSWFNVMPRYKVDKEGDVVADKMELVLKATQRTQEFIHTCEKLPGPRTFREVNCSLEATSWCLEIFRGSDAVSDTSTLKGCEIVTMYDPETRSSIGLGLAAGNNDEDSSVVSGDSAEQDELGSVKSMSNEIENAFMPGEILLEPDPLTRSSTNLWIIEPVGSIQGNPVNPKNDKVRFRHLIRGLYLTIRISKVNTRAGETVTISLVDSTDDLTDPGTVFAVQEIYQTGSAMRDNKPIQIMHGSNIWLGRGDMTGDAAFKCDAKQDKSNAINWIVARFAGSKFTLSHEPFDVHVGTAAVAYLYQFLDEIQLPHDQFALNVTPQLEQHELDFFANLMKALTMFVQGFTIAEGLNVASAEDEVLCRNEKLMLERQVLVREMGIINSCLLILDRLIPISTEGDKLKLASKGTTSSAKKKQIEYPLYLVAGESILKQVLIFIFQTIRGNPDNQMYVGDFLPVLLSHLGTQPFAAKCVNEMLSNNMELQEKKVGKREISIFISKLRASKMNPMYLKLLQSCCSCQGDGVDGNQVKVAEMLFEDLNDVIILLQADYKNTFRAQWNTDSLYLVWDLVPGSPMLASELLTEGVPRLSLSWTTNSIEFSPLGLFGKLSVPIEESYRMLSTDNGENQDWLAQKSTKGKGVNKSEMQKQAVADYFISELYLCAEMCMDRNYIGMQKLQPLFPYYILVSILKHRVNDELKASAITLLECLYVDRDPQAGVFLPRLTRTFTSLADKDSGDLPVVPLQYINSFAILQDFVSDHVKGMAGNIWSMLSHRVLSLLNKLVKFSFYGTEERLVDLFKPLVLCLDRRSLEVIYADKSHGKKNKPKASPRPVSGEKVVPVEELDPTGDGTFGDGSYEPDSETEKHVDWQKKTLDFLESITTLIMVLFIVIIAVAVTIYQILSGEEDKPGTWLFAVGIVILAIFVVELVLRMYCYGHVHGEISSFFKDSLNVVDIVVVLVDILFLFMPTENGGGGSGFFRTARLLRMIRLVRILRAARVVHALTKAFTKKNRIEWKEPLRYEKTSPREINAMIEAVDILVYATKIIDDRNLSVLLRHFHDWIDDPEGDIMTHFQNTLTSAREFKMADDEFEAIMCDLVMFRNTSLVQSVLDILVAHYSSASVLMANLKDVQLLVSPQNERKFMLISQIVRQLESNAETQELWGGLLTPEDKIMSTQTHSILDELLDLLRKESKSFNPYTEYIPDKEIQTMLSNLGSFDIFFKIFDLLDTIENPDEMNEAEENTVELVKKCMSVMYWYCWGNKNNQSDAFKELDFFLDNLDEGIDTHLVIEGLFWENEENMKLCPRCEIEKVIKKICIEGRYPHYLTLLKSITNVGEKNIVENQFEIVKQLLDKSRLHKVTNFLCSPSDKEYSVKSLQMRKFAGVENVRIADLPYELQYHLELLDVLSCCTIGRENMSAIEAKVQAVFSQDDILKCILDPDCILIVKCRLALHFFNAFIDVEMVIPGFEHSQLMWNWMSTFPAAFDLAYEDLIRIRKNYFDTAYYNRNNLEYLMVLMRVLQAFLSRYYDPTSFRLGEKIDVANDGDFQQTKDNVTQLLSTFFDKTKAIKDLKSPIIEKVDSDVIMEVLHTLNQLLTHAEVDEDEKLEEESVNDVEEDYHDNSMDEEYVLSRLVEFTSKLEKSEELMEVIAEEDRQFVRVLEALPFEDDTQEHGTDLRREPFIKKLVNHVYECLEVVNNERYLNSRCTKSTTWLMKALRKVIENSWGMSIYERDEEGGAEQDEASMPIIEAFDKCGVTHLCIDLISLGIDEGLQIEVLRLFTAMLYKEGGALMVQESANRYLNGKDTSLFFLQIKKFIQDLIGWHKWNDITFLESDEDEPDFPPTIIVVRFWQLLSEGHYLPNQDITKEQPKNSTSVNLLDDILQYLNVLSRLPCRTSTDASIRVANTILEVLQGPCVSNQLYWALQTDLLETMNRIMRQKAPTRENEVKLKGGEITEGDAIESQEYELKTVVVDIFRGLLEGQPKKSPIYDRVISVMHFDVIVHLCYPVEIGGYDESQLEDDCEELAGLRVQCLVLLQTLCDYKPQLRGDLSLPSDVPADVGSVEVVWNGQLQRRFFHIPDICWLLAESSKQSVVNGVNRSSHQNQLHEFLGCCDDLYTEIKHQEFLRNMGLSQFFSINVLDRVSWLSFWIVVVINCLFLWYYETVDGYQKGDLACARRQVDDESDAPENCGNAFMPDEAMEAVYALNVVLCLNVALSLLEVFVVKVPVILNSHLDNDELGLFYSYLLILTDPNVAYYGIYFALTIFTLFGHQWLLSFLLLDILAKDRTAQDVSQAVIIPCANGMLPMTCILLLFVVYIFAFFCFQYYSEDFGMDDFGMGDAYRVCKTLWGCFLFCFGYGLRFGGGLADIMKTSFNIRYLYDFLFFLAINLVLMNVVFGIIIDTFAELRADKEENDIKITEICFICNIDKEVFDRVAPSGFRKHVQMDHKMWNYLFFIVHLYEQDKDDDDGLEWYVRRCIEKKSLDWFPLNKAMCLNQKESDDEILRQRLDVDIKGIEESLGNDIAAFRDSMKTSIQDIIHSTVQGHNKIVENLEQIGAESGFGFNPLAEADLAVQLVEINNLLLSDVELKQIHCRIIASDEKTFYSVKSLKAGKNKVILESKQLVIAEAVSPTSDKKMSIQIILNSGKAARSIAVIELSYGDLHSARGTGLQVPFRLENTENVSFLRLRSCDAPAPVNLV